MIDRIEYCIERCYLCAAACERCVSSGLMSPDWEAMRDCLQSASQCATLCRGRRNTSRSTLSQPYSFIRFALKPARPARKSAANISFCPVVTARKPAVNAPFC